MLFKSGMEDIVKKHTLTALLLAALLAFASCGQGEVQTDISTDDTAPQQAEDITQAQTEPAVTEPAQTEAEDYIISENELELRRQIDADYAALLDVGANTVLYDKGGLDTRIYPASTTKLLTALVALKYCDPETTVFTAGNELELVRPGSSLAYVRRGHVLKLDTLIAGMLMKSGNDAAYVVAAGVGAVIAGDENISREDAVKRFVREMNIFAQEHGMENSHFTCPDGYHDDEHYTTMRDMFTVAKLAVENETIMKYTNTVSQKFYYESGENITWDNTNALINPDSTLYYKYATGLKTGTTSAAGNCVLASAEKDGQVLIACIFHSPDTNGKFQDAKTLFAAVLGTR